MPAEINQLIEETSCLLKNLTDSPLLDAQVLAAHILDQPRAWILAHLDRHFTPIELEHFLSARAELLRGVPLPYVIGRWEFYGLDLLVTPDVLIPRPETELLVDAARNWLNNHAAVELGVDVGTGSGCIAVALLKNLPKLRMVGVDISSRALYVAQENARRYDAHSRFFPIQSDLLTAFAGKFPLICANLPYIPSAALQKTSVFGREPTLALHGGADGMDLIRRIIPSAVDLLANPGLMLLEIEAGQGEAVGQLAHSFFPQASIRVEKDMAGLDRLVTIRMGG
jgi:release factor glutamine methyltransferase